MSVTAASHGERAAEIFFWEAVEATVTLDLEDYAASWLCRGERRTRTPAEGTWLKFTTSFEIQTKKAKKLWKKRKAHEIYSLWSRGDREKDGFVLQSHW